MMGNVKVKDNNPGGVCFCSNTKKTKEQLTPVTEYINGDESTRGKLQAVTTIDTTINEDQRICKLIDTGDEGTMSAALCDSGNCKTVQRTNDNSKCVNQTNNEELCHCPALLETVSDAAPAKEQVPQTSRFDRRREMEEHVNKGSTRINSSKFIHRVHRKDFTYYTQNSPFGNISLW